MLQFVKVDKENLEKLKPWFAAQNTHISDFSLGFQFMWNKHLSPDYAICGDSLILRELYTGKYYFHYPLSLSGGEEEEDGALTQIEAYCRKNDMRLHFTNVPQSRIVRLVVRYGQDVIVTNPRRWRDYLYEAECFKNYAGGRYAGQRNHVNKFLKNYPLWEFRPYREEYREALFDFLRAYGGIQKSKNSFLAKEELDEVYDIVPYISKLGLLCGLLVVDGRIVAFSAGERCGDTVVVHIEKALREYEGVYPFVAQQFARTFCGEGVRYLNRMDDAGDGGLRKSKLQYLPCEIVDKYTVIPKRAIDSVSRLPEINSQRLTLAPAEEKDGEAYFRLASDAERNRWWGYDYRNDCAEGAFPDAEWFLGLAREDFHRKNEMPLGVYEGGKLIGEVVLHKFGYSAQAEIGVRLLPEAEGNGYAQEAVRAYAEYAFLKLGLERVEAKCFKENARSRKMLLSAGMRACGEDGVYYYFYKTPAM